MSGLQASGFARFFNALDNDLGAMLFFIAGVIPAGHLLFHLCTYLPRLRSYRFLRGEVRTLLLALVVSCFCLYLETGR